MAEPTDQREELLFKFKLIKRNFPEEEVPEYSQETDLNQLEDKYRILLEKIQKKEQEKEKRDWVLLFQVYKRAFPEEEVPIFTTEDDYETVKTAFKNLVIKTMPRLKEAFKEDPFFSLIFSFLTEKLIKL